MRDVQTIDHALVLERARLLIERQSKRTDPKAIADEWERIDQLLDERLEASH